MVCRYYNVSSETPAAIIHVIHEYMNTCNEYRLYVGISTKTHPNSILSFHCVDGM